MTNNIEETVRWLAVSQDLTSPSAALDKEYQRAYVTQVAQKTCCRACVRARCCRGSGRGLEVKERAEGGRDYPEKRSGGRGGSRRQAGG